MLEQTSPISFKRCYLTEVEETANVACYTDYQILHQWH